MKKKEITMQKETIKLKSIVVIDTPESCEECCCREWLPDHGYACGLAKTIQEYAHGRSEWCPLRPLPQKMKVTGIYNSEYFGKGGKPPSYKLGWNACIDEITGGK